MVLVLTNLSSCTTLIEPTKLTTFLSLSHGYGTEALIRIPSNFGWLQLQPESKTFRWWSWSLKFGFRFHSPTSWGKRVVQIIQWFSFFSGPNHSGPRAGAKIFQMLEPKKFRCLELEPEIGAPAPQP